MHALRYIEIMPVLTMGHLLVSLQLTCNWIARIWLDFIRLAEPCLVFWGS